MKGMLQINILKNMLNVYKRYKINGTIRASLNTFTFLDVAGFLQKKKTF